MTRVTSKALDKSVEVNRVLGKYSQDKDGPAFIITAGVHGNEPSGIMAYLSVMKQLEKGDIPFKGEVTGLAGNLTALGKDVRFIDRDLNRVCYPETADELKAGREPELHEEKEFLALVREFEKAQGDRVQLYFLELHTTSSASQPYISVNREDRCFGFTKNFPMYVVKGIEKYIPGHVDYYLHAKGHTGCTVEAGQHDALTSIENHEAAIWLGLVQAGCIEKTEFPDFGKHYAALKKTLVNGNLSFEVIHRYDIADGEKFKMEPDYVNFQPIEKGEKLATSNGEPVISEWDANIFMPLYQAQGKDGFFVVRKVGE